MGYTISSSDQIPSYLRWLTPGRHQGQSVEVQYAHSDPSWRSMPDEGAEYKRLVDHSVGPRAITYYRRDDVAAVRWTTWGRVRGQGRVYETRGDAERDLSMDRRGCEHQSGYSDREVYLIDGEGWVVDSETGANVWPYGRTHCALRIAVQS